jgi:hypothetical protein
VPIAGILDVYNALVLTSNTDGLVHIGSAILNAVRMKKLTAPVVKSPMKPQ